MIIEQFTVWFGLANFMGIEYVSFVGGNFIVEKSRVSSCYKCFSVEIVKGIKKKHVL